MADLSDLTKKKEALDRARFGGAKTVQHGDKSVTFKSQTELDKASAALGDEITKASGRKRTRQIRICTNRGL